jgi:tRNA pseudouridine(38-40) synthase
VRTMVVYKLIVAYDGYRFHGFQRQMDNAAMMAAYHPCGNDNERGGKSKGDDGMRPTTVRPRKKRPHCSETDGNRSEKQQFSVQQVIEMALLDLFRGTTVESIRMKFAGRTDKGVSARGQVVAIHLNREQQQEEENYGVDRQDDESAVAVLAKDGNDVGVNGSADIKSDSVGDSISSWRLRRAMNSRLPVDVSVEHVEIVDATFQPRHHVRTKQYTYTIRYRRWRATDWQLLLLPSSSATAAAARAAVGGPHTTRHALDAPSCLWVCPWSLDDSVMVSLCERLQGTHDYSNFVHKSDRDAAVHEMTIDAMKFDIVHTKDEYFSATGAPDMNVPIPVITARFTLEATGFRRQLIRNLIGYCVDVCRGRPNVASIDTVFTPSAATASSIHAAPASGLCLESISY